MKSLIILISLILALHADKSFAQSGKKERDEFYQRSIEDKKAPQKNMFKSAHKKVDEKKKKKHYVSSKSKNKTNSSNLIDHSADNSNQMSKNLSKAKKQ